MKGCLDWMIEDGVADPSLRALDWEEYDLNLRNPDYGPFGVRQAEQICEKFFCRSYKRRTVSLWLGTWCSAGTG